MLKISDFIKNDKFELLYMLEKALKFLVPLGIFESKAGRVWIQIRWLLRIYVIFKTENIRF